MSFLSSAFFSGVMVDMIDEAFEGLDDGGALAFGGRTLGDLVGGDHVFEPGVGEEVLERRGGGGVEHLAAGGSFQLEFGVLGIAGELPCDLVAVLLG